MEPTQIQFQLKTIELLSFSLNAPQTTLANEYPCRFDITIEQQCNPEEKKIKVIATIAIIHEADQQQLASLQSCCLYQIENLADFNTNPATKQVSLPDQLIITLNSISISTTRGILFAQLRGTYLHNLVMPIVDPTQFVTNNNIPTH